MAERNIQVEVEGKGTPQNWTPEQLRAMAQPRRRTTMQQVTNPRPPEHLYKEDYHQQLMAEYKARQNQLLLEMEATKQKNLLDLAEKDAELNDSYRAERRMRQQGFTLGDYDLAAETARETQFRKQYQQQQRSQTMSNLVDEAGFPQRAMDTRQHNQMQKREQAEAEGVRPNEPEG